MKNIRLFCVVMCGLIGSTNGLAQDKTSLVGTWKMDVAQSGFGSDAAPKSVTLIILKDTPQMLSWRVRDVDEKGKLVVLSWIGPEDGSMHPVIADGKTFGQQSAKREQDGTRVRRGEDPDGSVYDSHDSLSPDGNTLTEEITSKSKDGKETTLKLVLRRVGGSASAKPA
jgi:hypothetical protein